MTAPEWRDVSALRALLESSNHLVDYHGGEILDRLDEAPQFPATLIREIGARHTEDLRLGRDDPRCTSCQDEAWPCVTEQILQRARDAVAGERDAS